MEQSPITQKITRRFFNGVLATFSFLGFGKAKAQAEVKTAEEEVIDKLCDEEKAKDEATDYMEVLILPDDFKPPYSAKVREVIANHLKAGKSRYEIKKWILEHSKVIRIPIK